MTLANEKLAQQWPACRTNHTKAAIKINVVASALVAGPRHVALYSIGIRMLLGFLNTILRKF